MQVRWLSVKNCLKNLLLEYPALVGMLGDTTDPAAAKLRSTLLNVDIILSSHVYSRMLELLQVGVNSVE